MPSSMHNNNPHGSEGSDGSEGPDGSEGLLACTITIQMGPRVQDPGSITILRLDESLDPESRVHTNAQQQSRQSFAAKDTVTGPGP